MVLKRQCNGLKLKTLVTMKSEKISGRMSGWSKKIRWVSKFPN